MNPIGPASGPLKVLITIDVEYAGMSQVGRPGGRDLSPASMDCMVEGKAYGLPFIVDTLVRHGLKATFFVEPLAKFHFGEAALERTVSLLLRAGQDVQLHLHPCWLFFRDGRTYSDRLFDHTEEMQASLLSLGKAILEGMGADIQAFRAGGFAADDRVYPALKAAGIPLSSSYCLAFGGSDCRITGAGSRNDLHPAAADRWEIPVSSFRIRDPRRLLGFAAKPFQVGCTTPGNARRVLAASLERGMSCLNLLLHNYELMDVREPGWYERPMRPNPSLVRGFEEICALLADSRGRWEVTTFREMASRISGWDRSGEAFSSFVPTLNRIYLPL